MTAPDDTAEADLVAGTVTRGGVAARLDQDRDKPIEALHRAILERAGEDVCDFAGGQRVLAMIDAVERSAREHRWVAL